MTQFLQIALNRIFISGYIHMGRDKLKQLTCEEEEVNGFVKDFRVHTCHWVVLLYVGFSSSAFIALFQCVRY